LVDPRDDDAAVVGGAMVIMPRMEIAAQHMTVKLHARNSTWWYNYVDNPPLNNPKFHKLFRLRFRLPYEQ
jgi:uncharacterized protein (DUF1778 family)